MWIAQISDTHIRPPGVLYQGIVDSNAMVAAAIGQINALALRDLGRRRISLPHLHLMGATRRPARHLRSIFRSMTVGRRPLASGVRKCGPTATIRRFLLALGGSTRACARQGCRRNDAGAAYKTIATSRAHVSNVARCALQETPVL
jgi:hypothetical protein